MSVGPRVVHTRNPGPCWPPCSFCARWSLPCPALHPPLGLQLPACLPLCPEPQGWLWARGGRGSRGREFPPGQSSSPVRREGVGSGSRLWDRRAHQQSGCPPERSGALAVRSCCSGFARWPVTPLPAHPGQGPHSRRLSTGSLLGDTPAFRGSWTASASLSFFFEGPHRMSLSSVGDPIGVTGR